MHHCYKSLVLPVSLVNDPVGLGYLGVLPPKFLSRGEAQKSLYPLLDCAWLQYILPLIIPMWLGFGDRNLGFWL